MRIQGGSEDEQIRVTEIKGLVKLQEAHVIAQEYLQIDKKVISFDVLSAIKENGFWCLRCYVEYEKYTSLIEIVLNSSIEQFTEMLRVPK